MAEKGELCGGCGYRFTTEEQAYHAPKYLKAPNVACGCEHTKIGDWERAKHAAGLHHYRGWRAGDTPNQKRWTRFTKEPEPAAETAMAAVDAKGFENVGEPVPEDMPF